MKTKELTESMVGGAHTQLANEWTRLAKEITRFIRIAEDINVDLEDIVTTDSLALKNIQDTKLDILKMIDDLNTNKTYIHARQMNATKRTARK